MNKTTILLAGLILAGHLLPVDAKASQPLANCVQLSNAHEGTRSGTQYLLLKDGDTHYRVGFGGSCDALARSSIVQVATGREKNKLCAKGSNVSSRTDFCPVRSVETIDADEYARVARRNRR
ncbi:MAG: hypothetical protein LCH89_05795 [Proteobacteria bacterium]|nr:hypothetical protein [Pseudomonadota bacterium]